MRNAEQWKAFDLADWALDLLFAHYTRLIYLERQKPAPDTAQIAQWQQEQRTLHDESDALRIEDQANSERVLNTYGPLARALNQPANPA
ncbi:hypothetical protein [Pseudomonas aeruginosa]|uniref:hypothetical protein n=1 Tax=Pseudomonas aeruginosa TaxID=287 RepID=UPI000EB4E41A|nr:hypothetical protein [Pseudomonas aeruginosa]MCT4937269.1 hypothetical protein [Pseudomonas aeruginosa]NNB82300.1 hypothetical protein [Pseudomonas aeruginosa]RUB20509.1 hypothetical protein IPC1432_31970 [Pseudomonas aeruginosa]